MDELRESSLLFSLESLLETERERVQREAREAQRRREDELARVAELAERRRVSLQQERESKQRRLALEQERERMDQERLEAMKQAAVERARIEAESQLRLVEAEQARKHELSLSQLREGERTALYRTLTWLSTGALVLSLVGAFATYFGMLEPAQARREQQLQSVIGIDAEKAKTSERLLGLELRKNQTLAARVAELEALKREPAPAPAALKPVVRPSDGGHRGPAGGSLGTGPCIDDGDPLNKCLGGRRPR
jgi:colicin import membrane protein